MTQAISLQGSEPLKLEDLHAKTLSEMEAIKYPGVVIEELLRKQEILLMGGSSKAWKSWARMDLLYCVANGFSWFGFKTRKGIVLHLDLELLAGDIYPRFNQIHQTYCQAGMPGSLENILIISLRGKPFGPENLNSLIEAFAERQIVLLSLDPLYRLLGGKGENDAAAVTELLTKFLHISAKLDVAIALLQHFTKGDQSQKESQDRFSGSGVWARFPDALLTFTENEAGHNTFSCEFTVRSFQPIEPFAVRWQFPRFWIDQKLDPGNIKTRTVHRTPKFTAEQICDVLNSDQSISWTDWFKKCHKLFGIGETSFRYKVNFAKEQKMIFLNTDNRYELSAAYIEKNGQ